MGSQSVLRSEKKYQITYGDACLIRTLLRPVLSPDPNSGPDGTYFVRSVYFDTPLDRDYYEKLQGLHTRNKIRIRTYSPSSETFKLELKHKEGDLLTKESLTINTPESLRIIKGDYSAAALVSPEGTRLYRLLKQDCYRPKIMIDYTREAYVHPFSNLRINIDRSIRATSGTFDLHAKDPNMNPVVPDSTCVLEIKYSGYLPDWLRALLSQLDLTQTSYSKYCLSRHL